MVGLGRLELPTRSLGNSCSIYLSYKPSAHCSSDSLRGSAYVVLAELRGRVITGCGRRGTILSSRKILDIRTHTKRPSGALIRSEKDGSRPPWSAGQIIQTTGTVWGG